MYNLTYFGGCWNEKLEFWNLVFFVRKSSQNEGGVLKNMVFIYIVVVVVEYINSKIPRFQRIFERPGPFAFWSDFAQKMIRPNPSVAERCTRRST